MMSLSSWAVIHSSSHCCSTIPRSTHSTQSHILTGIHMHPIQASYEETFLKGLISMRGAKDWNATDNFHTRLSACTTRETLASTEFESQLAGDELRLRTAYYTTLSTIAHSDRHTHSTPLGLFSRVKNSRTAVSNNINVRQRKWGRRVRLALFNQPRKVSQKCMLYNLILGNFCLFC